MKNKLETIIDQHTCNWYKSYITALDKPNANEFTKSYVEYGCDKCEGRLYEAICYYNISDNNTDYLKK